MISSTGFELVRFVLSNYEQSCKSFQQSRHRETWQCFVSIPLLCQNFISTYIVCNSLGGEVSAEWETIQILQSFSSWTHCGTFKVRVETQNRFSIGRKINLVFFLTRYISFLHVRREVGNERIYSVWIDFSFPFRLLHSLVLVHYDLSIGIMFTFNGFPFYRMM